MTIPIHVTCANCHTIENPQHIVVEVNTIDNSLIHRINDYLSLTGFFEDHDPTHFSRRHNMYDIYYVVHEDIPHYIKNPLYLGSLYGPPSGRVEAMRGNISLLEKIITQQTIVCADPEMAPHELEENYRKLHGNVDKG